MFARLVIDGEGAVELNFADIMDRGKGGQDRCWVVSFGIDGKPCKGDGGLERGRERERGGVGGRPLLLVEIGEK